MLKRLGMWFVVVLAVAGLAGPALSEEGHAQARRLSAQVLQHVREDQRWIEDRNFCTLGLLFGMARRGAAFVVRQHGQVQGDLLGRPTRKGTTRSGRHWFRLMSSH